MQQIVVKPQGPGSLTTGPAPVQICVYDNVTGVDSCEPVGGIAASYPMQHVVVSHAH